MGGGGEGVWTLDTHYRRRGGGRPGTNSIGNLNSGHYSHQSHLFLGRDTYLSPNPFDVSKCAVGNFAHQSHLFFLGGGAPLVTTPLGLFINLVAIVTKVTFF